MSSNLISFQSRPDLAVEAELCTLDIINGEAWEFLRKSLSPTLTSGKIKGMMKITQEVADNACQHIAAKCAGSTAEVNTKELASCVTLEVIQERGLWSRRPNCSPGYHCQGQ